jgi:hypothetical protein
MGRRKTKGFGVGTPNTKPAPKNPDSPPVVEEEEETRVKKRKGRRRGN